jgi:hypothetical protein
MLNRHNPWVLWWFAATTLVSAFLVFQVQPVISKTVLPWFGGSPAVWTTCLLFFQTLLFAGYAYAHLLTRFLSLRYQGAIHLTLMIVGLTMLPIAPSEAWKPTGTEQPMGQILLILAANVGLPYFLLSATGPLVQAWFRHRAVGRSPYRLYALSNVGSLAALLTYPFAVERLFTTTEQSQYWSMGFCLFVLLCGYLAAGLLGLRQRERADRRFDLEEPTEHASPGPRQWIVWLALPAFASVMLLATTNHVCQDVAVIPFLWIAPLSLYLITFIICFDRETWYSRRWCGAAAALSLVILSLAMQFEWHRALLVEIASYLSAMFFVCMVCHGELVRNKPHPRYLTSFYLMSSAGGAVGGLVVAVVCPLLFSTHLEMNLSIIGGIVVAMWVLLTDACNSWLGDTFQRRVIAGLAYFAAFLFVGAVQLDWVNNTASGSVRNFYGVLHVEHDGDDGPTTLIHGRVVHGVQFGDPTRKHLPTTYYAPESGVGLTLANLREDRPLHIGAVGLGCGTVAAYGRSGDRFRFYEINPAVVTLARRDFTFLESCAGDVEIVLGDARLSMEREPSQRFDVLILDAFSGDAIPVHLLTREAFSTYVRHLKPDGVIAVHLSNRHLNLEPVVFRLAEEAQLECVQINNRKDRKRAVFAAKWVLLSNNQGFLGRPQIQRGVGRIQQSPDPQFPLWTDQYNNLIQILDVM